MPELKELSPEEIDNHPNKVLDFYYRKEEYKADYYYYWLLDDGFLTWATRYLDEEETDAITYLRIPLRGLAWFVRMLEYKFFKTEAEGGLEAGKFTYSEEVDGEKLVISRSFGHPGYCFLNFSRKSYLRPKKQQEANFSDEWLFEMGLFDQLKKLANRIENGEI